MVELLLWKSASRFCRGRTFVREQGSIPAGLLRPNRLVGVFCFVDDPPGFAPFSVALCAPASVISVLNLCLCLFLLAVDCSP